MLDLKNSKVAIPIVLIAGVFWSFGPYVVRHIDQPETVPWQYLFTRGLVIFLLLNMYLFLEEGKDFYKNYFKVGISGVVGGIGLGTAMITFIWSITNTTAAITLLCLAAMPFITALLGFLFLKEKVGMRRWSAVIVGFVGVIFVTLVPFPIFINIALAVGVGIFLMILFNIVHPPAGGNPIMVIIGSVSYDYLLSPIIFGCIIIISLAILINKFLLKKNYPLK